MRKKRVEESKTEQFRLLKYEDINGANRLFGGKLMAWIDEVAGVTARRHCETDVTTACIDNLQFKEPAFLGNMIVIIGRLTYIGRSSMEVRVDSYVEDSKGFRRPINRAYVTMVAIDEHEKPKEVAFGLELETETEKIEWESGKKRAELRKQRRREGF
ncbi:MAG: acyl-CoA thioesterase [Lachnospiraceae bacterium]|nr:acyl-CoA thioesterase [Lachnospiraceae bacterium]